MNSIGARFLSLLYLELQGVTGYTVVPPEDSQTAVLLAVVIFFALYSRAKTTRRTFLGK